LYGHLSPPARRGPRAFSVVEADFRSIRRSSS